MNRLTLLLAWLAPMITVELLARRGHNLKLNRLRGGWWAVRVAPHRFSYAPSLRTALVAALRKVKPAQQENPPHA